MLYTVKVEETVEYADLINKVQSIIDYVSTETTDLQDDREFAMQSNQAIVHQMINNNIKQNYVIESTLLAIRRDIEYMHDDIQTNIKKEKSASVQSANSTDNAKTQIFS